MASVEHWLAVAQYPTIAVCAFGTVRAVVWLAGLAIVLRGAKPKERAAILRAYRSR